MREERRQALLEALCAMRDGPAGCRTEAVADEDRWAGEIAQQVASALAEIEADALGQIEDAIRRLREGRYGTCADCHGEIPGERLAAPPFAALCRPCQDGREGAEAEPRRSGDRSGRTSPAAASAVR